MSCPIQLFPTPAYPNGKPVCLEVELVVPNMGTPISIEKVYLISKEIFVLCKVSERALTRNCTGISSKRIAIKIPDDMDESCVRVNHFVLGKTWSWSHDSYEELKFISHEDEFHERVNGK